MSDLRKYLEFVTGMMRANYGGNDWDKAPSVDRFILAHGRAFPFDADSFKGPHGPMGMCYMNAGRRAMANRKLTYVEGKVSVYGCPLDHAWLVNGDGKVIDPTIRDPKGIGEYFGVPIKTHYMNKAVLRAGTWGVLDWEKMPRVVKDDPDDIVKT